MAAQKRMFDKAIIDTDRFMDLSMSTKALYFLMGMESDDEGFVSPKKVMRIHGGNDDDIRVLIAKNFIIPFESGVVVITDWNKNNWLDSRRVKPTEYQKEKKLLSILDDKSYSLSNRLASAQPVQYRIEENRGEERRIEEENTAEQAPMIVSIIEMFCEINPACKKMYSNKTQRQACKDLIDTYSFEEVTSCIQKVLPRTNGQSYFPVITTPVQLRDKWISLKSAVAKKRGSVIEIIN